MSAVTMFKELVPGDLVFAKDQLWLVISHTKSQAQSSQISLFDPQDVVGDIH